jgi:hypothetical protein
MEVAENLKVTKEWVDRMLAHPLLKDHITRRDYFHAHAVLQNEAPAKYQLSIEYLDQTCKK